MVSAWYAIVFMIGMCFGAFYRVSEVVQLKKKVKMYQDSMVRKITIPKSWTLEDIAVAKEDEESLSTQAKDA